MVKTRMMQRFLPQLTRFQAKIWFAFLMFLGLFTGLNAQVQSRSYQFVLRKLLKHTVPELNVETVTKNLNAYPIFIDAREWNEYNVSHIKGAIWVGYKDFDLSRMVNVGKESPIVVYCSVGYRSEKIAEKLIAAGYPKVYNLYGGVFEWANRKNVLYNHKGEETPLIHAYNRMWGTWLRIKKKHKVFT